MTAEQWIGLLKEHAVGLRDVGVLSIAVDGAAATFAPAPPPPPAAGDSMPVPSSADPLADPALYPDGVVPGYVLIEEPQ